MLCTYIYLLIANCVYIYFLSMHNSLYLTCQVHCVVAAGVFHFLIMHQCVVAPGIFFVKFIIDVTFVKNPKYRLFTR
jgi:hypothetical protein